MSLPQKTFITIEEFRQIKNSTDDLLEYIDGVIFMSPTPSTKHQRISSRIHAKLFNFLEGTDCEVFPAPFDIELKHTNIDENKIVIPDLSVICDKSGLTDTKYIGVPNVIMEILSPSNQSHDLVLKLNLYMQYGVKEYWIINPLLNIIQVYKLDDEGQYQQMDAMKEKGIIQSDVLKGFQLDLEYLFQEHK